MMIRRIFGTFVVLCFVLTGLVTVQGAAHATPLYLTFPGMSAEAVMANDDGSINISSCRTGPSTMPAGAFIDNQGAIKTILPDSTSSGLYCNELNQGFGFSSGVQYATRNPTSTTQELVAWKNGREIWATNIPMNLGTSCTFNTSRNMRPTNLAEGSDGNIYLFLHGYSYCNNVLYGFNPTTGSVVMDVSLGIGPTPQPGGIALATPGLWTYEDRIMVVDRGGMVREFGYDGIENMSVHYQFPIPNGHVAYQVAADDNGTIFAMTGVSTNSATPLLAYYRQDGTYGYITDTYAWTMMQDISLTADGNFVGIGEGSRLDYFDISTNTVSAVYPTPLTTGYPNARLDYYSEDENGNQLYLWSHQNANGTNRATTIDIYDASTSTTSTVYTREVKAGDPAYPSFYILNVGTIRNSINNGTLYLTACVENGCNLSTAISELYEVDLGVFGTPLGKGHKRNDYESQKLEYVAMGDSYSSGEGAPAFNPWTNRDSVNECHRSASYGYPVVLANDPATNLNLTDFVACSGATTENVLFGGNDIGAWNEPAQLDALSSSTDIVTISIGGNDIGFGEYAEYCTFYGECDSDNPSYQDAIDYMDESLASDLSVTYRSILMKAPAANVYVIGYPYLVDPTSSCVTFGWGDDFGVITLTDKLNKTIFDTIAEINSDSTMPMIQGRLHYVSTNYPNSPLEDHYICSPVPYFNQALWTAPPAYAYHPNAMGYEAYASILREELD